MITPHHFKTPKINIFNPDGSFLCEADEYTLLDLQLQIIQEKAEGYSYEWNDNKGTINSNGELSNWFYGMFDFHQNMFALMIRARKGEEVKMNEKFEKIYQNLLIKES